MGTTKDALVAGSLSFAWVVAIEGFPYLLTSGSAAAAVTAWSGTDWTQALEGLVVELDRKQAMNPWQPFPTGGSCTLRVVPDAADVFGVHLHRTDAGATTILKASLDCDDTTITVADASNFPAATAELFIGNECIEYDAKDATTFTASARGKYSPFPTNEGDGFARPHRVGLASWVTALEPVVSQYRRSWHGAKVGVWVHRVVGGVLDAKAEAQLVFAGEIVEYADDPQTGHAVVEVRDLIEIGERTLVRDQFRAKIADGIYVGSLDQFDFWDRLGSTTKTATSLLGTIGASGPYEIEVGWYTASDLVDKINTWLAAAKDDGDLHGDYSFQSPINTSAGSLRTNVDWQIAEALDSQGIWFSFEMPQAVGVLFGFIESLLDDPTARARFWSGPGHFGPELRNQFGDWPVRRWVAGLWAGDNNARLRLSDLEGEPFDNFEWLPQDLADDTGTLRPILPVDGGAGSWGIFTINGKAFAVGAINNGELVGARHFHDERTSPTYDEPHVDFELVQVYVIHGRFQQVIRALFFSTGTDGFNHANMDELPQALALNIPGSLLGDPFEESLVYAPDAEAPITVVINKATTLADLIGSDLLLRGMHLVWRDGHLVFRQWGSPLPENAIATLGESSKALPAGQKGSHRTASMASREWLSPIVKIQHSRVWSTDDYADAPLTFEDRGSVDDMGSDAPTRTIKARNMSRDEVLQVSAAFLARMPLVSRPAYLIRRTVDQRFYELLTPGDTVLVSDGFARDPTTGGRGVNALPGTVVATAYSLGGKSAAQVGEVTLRVYPGKRYSTYCPSAKIDPAADSDGFSSGYNASTNTIRVLEHEFSESSDPIDAARFAAGDQIEIVEADPADPASPIMWEREIDSISGSDIVLTAALSSPAWNANRVYYVRSQTFSQATTDQRVHVYQADAADARIEDEADPFHYAAPAATAPWTDEESTTKAERVPERAFADGAARCVAFERAAIRCLNAAMDHKTAMAMPIVKSGSSAVLLDGSPAANVFRLVMVQRRYFGRARPNSLVQRTVAMAPWFRSSDGSSVTLRISLTRWPPHGPSLDALAVGAPYSQFDWATNSTTGARGTPFDFDLSVLGDDGFGFVIVQATVEAELRGIVICREGARV